MLLACYKLLYQLHHWQEEINTNNSYVSVATKLGATIQKCKYQGNLRTALRNSENGWPRVDPNKWNGAFHWCQSTHTVNFNHLALTSLVNYAARPFKDLQLVRPNEMGLSQP